MDRKLNWGERIGFWFHIAMCHVCRRYARDIKKLHLLMLKVVETRQALLPASVKLSQQARERIKQVIKKAIY